MKKPQTKLFCSIVIIMIVIYNCRSLDESIDYDKNAIEEAINNLGQIDEFRSIAISYRGNIVAEEYFHGETSNPDSVLDVRSVTKSVTSLLTGIAIDKGYISSINQTLSEFITPDIADLNNQFSNITIRQLLTMQAGFEWKEINEVSEFGSWIRADDQLIYILNKSFINNPGEVFDYSDGAAHLMSIVLEQATGVSASEFAQINLFNNLGIGERYWYTDNRGYNYGGVGLIITVLDMISLGEMVLNKGIYNGTMVVSENWINESTEPQVSTHMDPLLGNHYGYYWWIANTDAYDFYYANGYGGQFIIIVEELDLVIATLSNFVRNGDANWSTIMNTIRSEIIPAFR